MEEPADPSPVDPTDLPTARRSLFDRPLFWLGLVAAGVVLAVVLSFAAERTDLSGAVGDVGAYCQQVAVVNHISSADLLKPGTDGSTQGSLLLEQLRSLERVAPNPVVDDVTVVRQSAEDALRAIASTNGTDAAAKVTAIKAAAQDLSAAQDAIGRMTEYTQEACGLDLGAATSVPSAPVSPSTTTR
jgi:hypothetical protein